MVDRNRNDSGRDYGRGTRDEGRDPGRGREPERGGRDPGRGAPASSRYTYQPRGREQVEKRQSMGANEFDKIFKPHIKMFGARDGLNRLRILPPTWTKPEHFGYDLFVHYGVGPDRDSYLDLQKMKGEPDPISEEQAELRRSGTASEQEVKDLDSKRRVAVYVVDRDNEAEGVQAWAMPWTIDRDINGVSVDHGTGEVLQIDDPEHGYDIEFTKTGKGIGTKYGAIAIARRESRLGKGEWLDFAIDNPLPDQLQFFSYDEIAKTFGGGASHRESSREERGGRDAPRDDRGGRDDPPSRDGSVDVGGRGGDGGRGRVAEPERAPADRDRGRSAEPALTWEVIHEMTGPELDALVDSDDRLHGIDVNKAESDAQVADWICEDLRIEKAAPRGRTRAESPPDDSAGDRLAQMRASRGRG